MNWSGRLLPNGRILAR
jgi:NADH dehydrogenase